MSFESGKTLWVMWFVWVEVHIVDGVMVSVKYMIHEAITG